MTLLEYLLSEEDADFLGISAASLVMKPANKSQAVFMSESDDVFMAPTEDMIVKGLFVRANQKVKQKFGGGKESFFSADTIKKMRNRFHKSGADKKITINHERDGGEAVYQDDCYVAESYLVKNEHDVKSLEKQGIQGAGIGDWVLGVKVSQDVWDNDVKTGEIEGLSLEGMFNSRTVAMSEFDRQVAEVEALARELFKDM